MSRRRYRLLIVHCLTVSAPDVLTWLNSERPSTRFEEVLTVLSIPCQPFEGDMQAALDEIFSVILSDDVQSSSTPGIILQEQRSTDSQLLVDFQ